MVDRDDFDSYEEGYISMILTVMKEVNRDDFDTFEKWWIGMILTPMKRGR